VQTTGGGVEEVGASALEPVHGPPQKRQKTVLTVSASLVPGDAGGGASSGTHCAIAEVGVPKSQLCTAAVSAAEGRVVCGCAAAGLRCGACLCRDGAPHRRWNGAGTPQHCRPRDRDSY
jgi:hypothetical protein